MIDYKNKETEVIDFIKNNFNNYLTEGSEEIKHFINEYLDFDKFNYSSTIWFEFDNYNYQELTNESKLETSNFRVFIVVKNNKETELHSALRDYATALYNMFESTGYNLGGTFDYGMITDVNFFDAVKGDKNKKLSEITFTMFRETI
jgi:hypothetical protein